MVADRHRSGSRNCVNASGQVVLDVPLGIDPMRDELWFGLLYDHNLGCPRHGLGCELRVGELGVLSSEICFNYPTGSRTSSSDEDRDFEFYDFGQRLAKGRPA